MLGLSKKVEKQVKPNIRDIDRRRAYLSRNGCILIPTMAGSHMVLMPRPENGGSTNWPESIPGIN